MPAVNTMFNTGPSAPHSGAIQTPSPDMSGASEVGANVGFTDGTPLRIATIMVVVILGLAGLKWAGFRFNVTSG